MTRNSYICGRCQYNKDGVVHKMYCNCCDNGDQFVEKSRDEVDARNYAHKAYCEYDIKSTMSISKDYAKVGKDLHEGFIAGLIAGNMRIKNVIFNEPATIVFWADGTKTVVKCQEGDEFDPEKGLTMAIAKKLYGNKGSYCEQIKKWTEPWYEKQTKRKSLVDRIIDLGRKAIVAAAALDACENAVKIPKAQEFTFTLDGSNVNFDVLGKLTGGTVTFDNVSMKVEPDPIMQQIREELD